MSLRVRDSLRSLFGSKEGADCVLRFYVQPTEQQHGSSGPRFLGEPLPAHQLVLRTGSGRLRLLIRDWRRQKPTGVAGLDKGTKKRKRTATFAHRPGPCGMQLSKLGKQPAKRTRSIARERASSTAMVDSDGQDLPELKVQLAKEEELEPALTATRYLYTGSLVVEHEQQHQGQGGQGQAQGQQQQQQQQGGGGLGVACGGRGLGVGELVVIRHVADALDIADCADACDAALVECFQEPPNGGSAGSSSSSSSSPASPLVPVLELYSFRHLLPSPDHHPGVGPVLAACRKGLVRHWDAQLPVDVESPEGTAPPTKVDLLAWLLGCTDAVRIANDPQLVQLWRELSAVALEELLQSDHLSTDDEATVVLLVEKWVVAQGSRVTRVDKARVREQLRLVNCNTAYLFDVLPKLPWLGPDPARQAAFLARCQQIDCDLWRQLGEQLGGYDTTTPWYGKPRPQSVPEDGVSYKWEISREELLEGLRKKGKVTAAIASFEDPGSSRMPRRQQVSASGFEWYLFIKYFQGESHAGLYLGCEAPTAIEAQTGPLVGACGVVARVEVADGGEEASDLSMEGDSVGIGKGWGWPEVLPLEVSQPGTAARQQGQTAAGGAGTCAGAGQQQKHHAHGVAFGGAAGVAVSDAALLAPWAKLLGPEGKIRGVLTLYGPEE